MTAEIIASITGFAAVVFGFIKWFLPFIKLQQQLNRKKATQAKFDEGLKSILRVNDLMDELRQHRHITRVVLLEISNGGDQPRPGSTMYASAVQVRRDTAEGDRDITAEKALKEKYNRVTLDDHYIRMLVQIQTSGIYKFNVKNSENCMLRNFYITECIKYSEIYPVYVDRDAKKMFILSIATDQVDQLFENGPTRAFICTAVTTIQSLFETYREI